VPKKSQPIKKTRKGGEAPPTKAQLKTDNMLLKIKVANLEEQLRETSAALTAALDPPMTESELHGNLHQRLALAVEQAHFAAAALVVIRGNIPHHSFMTGKDPTAFFKLYTGGAALMKGMIETLEAKTGEFDGQKA
jgi:hypothetical protein